MAYPTIDGNGQELYVEPFQRRPRRIRGVLGLVLTIGMIGAVMVSGAIVERDGAYKAIVIEAPAGGTKIRPQDPGGLLTRFQNFTLNDIIAGNDAPEAATVTGYAPVGAGLSEIGLSPRARRERVRLLNGTSFLRANAASSSPGRTSEAEAIWRSFVPSRRGGVRRILSGTVVPGTDVAQLGDFPDATAALIKWSGLEKRFPDLFAGVDWYLENAWSGGRQITRLRVTGFGAREIALWFCEELANADETCIPTVSR